MPLRDRVRYRAGRIRLGLKEWSEVLLLLVTTVAVICAVIATVVAIGTSSDATQSAGNATAAAEDATVAARRAASIARAQKRADDRAVERDAARTYQRCEQIEPVAFVAQLALDASPEIRAKVRRAHPEYFDEGGQLPVPDCERIYPRGFAVSDRYPDLTPTKPAP
jgi:Na+-transporting methylmalonyl-CoA/oxaloacetate decarboxylase gamma subunit